MNGIRTYSGKIDWTKIGAIALYVALLCAAVVVLLTPVSGFLENLCSGLLIGSTGYWSCREIKEWWTL